MLKKIIVVIFFLTCFSLYSQRTEFMEKEVARKEYQVSVFQKSCQIQEIENGFTIRAGELYEEYLKLTPGQRNENAYRKLEKAFIFYRLALGLNDLEKSQKRHQYQVESLQLAREELEELNNQLEMLKEEISHENESDN